MGNQHRHCSCLQAMALPLCLTFFFREKEHTRGEQLWCQALEESHSFFHASSRELLWIMGMNVLLFQFSVYRWKDQAGTNEAGFRVVRP